MEPPTKLMLNKIQDKLLTICMVVHTIISALLAKWALVKYGQEIMCKIPTRLVKLTMLQIC